MQRSGDEGGVDILPTSCPMREAPSCLRWALIRTLELGGSNYLPTNWMGFAEYFRINLEQMELTSAEEVIGYWVDWHPSCHSNTVCKVFKFARDQGHQKLLEIFDTLVQEHLLPDCHPARKPAECFRTCEKCCSRTVPPPLPVGEGCQPEAVEDLREKEHAPEGRRRRHVSAGSQPTASTTINAPVTQSHFINCTGPGPVNIYLSPSHSPSSSSPTTPTPSRSPSPKPDEQSSTTHQVKEKRRRPGRSSSPGSFQTLTPHTSLGLFQSPPEIPDAVPFVEAVEESRGQCPTYPEIPDAVPFVEAVEESRGQCPTYYIQDHVDPPAQPLIVTSPVPLRSNGSTTHCSESTNGKHPVVVCSGSSSKEEQLDSYSHSDNTTRRRRHLSTGNGEAQEDDRLHTLGISLFNTWPYRLFQVCYRKDLTRILFAALIAYQVLASVLISICERGGFRLIFQDLENTHMEILHRLVMLGLRMCARVVTPVCLFQPSVPTVVPEVPKTGVSVAEAKSRLVRVHKMFSPLREVHEVESNSIAEAFSLTECILKRQITSAWVVIVHSVLLAALLYYLGVFFLIPEKLGMKGVCNFSHVNATTIHLPLLSFSIHLLVFLELVSVFAITLIISLTKEFYCYENKIAVYATIALGAESTELYREIRKRWRVVDCYCYSMPLCLMALLVASVSTGKVFTPSISQGIEADDIANWYVWIMILSVLTFLAMSPNRMVKHCCLIGYLVVAIFIYVTDAEGVNIPAAGSSVMILLFVSLATIVFNLLFALSRCHLHHWREMKDGRSYVLMLYCFVCLCILPVLMIVTVCREVFHFRYYFL